MPRQFENLQAERHHDWGTADALAPGAHILALESEFPSIGRLEVVLEQHYGKRSRLGEIGLAGGGVGVLRVVVTPQTELGRSGGPIYKILDSGLVKSELQTTN